MSIYKIPKEDRFILTREQAAYFLGMDLKLYDKYTRLNDDVILGQKNTLYHIPRKVIRSQ